MNLPNILVLCTGNSCRSQMAEGLFRHLAGDQFTVHSAGTDPKPDVHPLAIEVMREIGIDISKQRPKDIKEFLGRLAMGYLIIVCDKANDSCPRIFPGRWERLFLAIRRSGRISRQARRGVGKIPPRTRRNQSRHRCVAE